MSLVRRTLALVVPCLALVASALVAQIGTTVPNWTVPPYRFSGGLTTMTDVSPGIAFVAMSPCRIVDTRNATGPYGGPALASNVARTFDIDNGPCTGIPAGVDAYSLSIGAILPPADGFLTAWPTGISQPTISQLNYLAGEVVANAAIVPAGTNGAINVLVNVGPTDVYIDINGYFSDQFNSPNYFSVVSNLQNVGGVIFGQNTNTTVAGAGGNFQALTAVDGGGGVFGTALANSGFVFGGKFRTNSSNFSSAGVKGINGYGDPYADNQDCGPCGTAGVRGVGASTALNYGVLGISRSRGVGGVVLRDDNNVMATGFLGYAVGFGSDTYYAGYFNGNVHITGTMTAAAKPFVQPHPYDAGKEIRYVAIEGPQAEVYFRGTAQVSRGVTRIAVPAHFRFVADPATYSAVATPVGAMATLAVLSEGEDGIVIQASRDVKVHYVVYAERSAFKNPDPIVENVHFRPAPGEVAEALSALPESYREIMIRNRTLNRDGTANIETAHRLGWDQFWKQRSRPVPDLTP